MEVKEMKVNLIGWSLKYKNGREHIIPSMTWKQLKERYFGRFLDLYHINSPHYNVKNRCYEDMYEVWGVFNNQDKLGNLTEII